MVNYKELVEFIVKQSNTLLRSLIQSAWRSMKAKAEIKS